MIKPGFTLYDYCCCLPFLGFWLRKARSKWQYTRPLALGCSPPNTDCLALYQCAQKDPY